jgi:hypothetical protein
VLFLAVLSLLVTPPAGAETVRIVPGESAAPSLEKRAEEIEAKLARNPDDAGLIASLTRTRIEIADSLITEGTGEAPAGSEEVRQQLTLAAVAWSKYLKVARKPSPRLASVVAPALFQLAELSATSEEALKNVKAAVTAQKIVVEGRPGKNSWSTLAFYYLFAQNYKAADKALEKAISYTHSAYERESLEKMFNEVEKSAKRFGKKLKRR